MMTTLDKIVAAKKQELSSLRRKVSLKDVQWKANDAEPPRPFLQNFRKGGINIIAEIKKASPSAGVICHDFKPLDIARIYEENGAKALSVLTDEHFFMGSLGILSLVKKKVKLPCLRKDFTLDEYHVYEARGAGADAVLLIASLLDLSQLKDYSALCEELGMKALIEIHDENDLEKISSAEASFIGVNNRNLKTFAVDVQTSHQLIKQMPGEATRISESGLKNHQDLIALKQAGFDGFLIGETLMREKNLGKKLEELIRMDDEEIK